MYTYINIKYDVLQRYEKLSAAFCNDDGVRVRWDTHIMIDRPNRAYVLLYVV